MHYLIGDLQGCCDALDRLLLQIDFSPSRDHVHMLGDLVNRGPASLATLQRLRSFGTSATCLLGNHDLHLLAVAAGVRKPHRKDTLGQILASTERDVFDAEEAQRIGVVQELTDPGQQVERAIALGESIAKQAPLAVQASRANAKLAMEQGHAAAYAALMTKARALMATEDAAEGLRSFMERREADFRGR